jgi:glutamate racemase
VLRELRLSLPQSPLHYVADTAYMPYGDRTLAEVRERALCISRYLIQHGASIIVVACNTASAAALHTLRLTFTTTQFVGMEPAVKPAAQATQSRVIGVLATRATFQGELFASVVERFASDVRVIAQPCAGLADAIERGEFDSPKTERMLRRWLLPMV